MTQAAAQDLRIAVVFFGITRSLRFTQDSISRNVIAPARAVAAQVGLFAHFYDQDTINNPRSGEVGPLDPEEYRLLPWDGLEREPPGDCLAGYPMDALMQNGDFWRNKFRAFRNLVHQLHSLRRATELAATFRPDITVFARPDLWYLTPMTPYLQALAHDPQPQVMLPDWARWEGLNDRLALVRGDGAATAYGHRVAQMQAYCADGRMLHSEQLLQHALTGQRVQMVPIHAARVRSDGRVVREDFRPGHGRGGGGKTLAFHDFLATQAAEARP
jgi:hypothetical protein